MKMKKTRLLSLALVLAMVLALVPTVFAANGLAVGTIAFASQAAVTGNVGDKLDRPTATCTNTDTGENADKHHITYTIVSASPSGCVTIGTDADAGKLIAVKAGTAKLKAACDCGAEVAEANYIDITIGKKALNPTITINNFNMKTGTSQTLVEAELAKKYEDAIKTYENKDVLNCSTWTLGDNGTFDNTANTQLTYTAKVTVKDTDNYQMDEKTLTVVVTFKDAPQIKTVTQKVSNTAGTLTENTTLNCGVGATGKQLNVSVATEPASGVTLKYEWLSGTTYSITANGYSSVGTNDPTYTLTSAETTTAGTKYYACKITATNADNVSDEYLARFTVKVNELVRVVLKKYSGTNTVGQRVAYTATVQKYAPDAKGADAEGYITATPNTDFTSVTFAIGDSNKAALVSSSTQAAITTLYLDLKAGSSTTLTASLYTASAPLTPATTTSETISISSASASTVTISPTNATYALLDETQLTNAVSTATRNTSANSYSTPYKFAFTGVNGTFSLTGASSYSSTYTAYTYTTPRVGSVYFVPNTSYGFNSQNVYVTYTAYDYYGNPIATGTINFGASASITYSTTANTPVYFSSSDFQSFYQQAVNSKYATLSSITITGTPTIIGSATAGTLTYSGYSYGQSGYYSTYFANISASNIGNLAYTPSSSMNSYSVNIPFTAYGSYGYSQVSGIVTIKVNDGHIISMVGTDFKSANVWTSDVSSKYPSASYIRFATPQSNVGKLYYGYTSIANKGSLVSSTDNYYNNVASTSSTQRSINNVYFVPAADCLNTVTLSYTAYNGNSAIGTGTITFTVSKKTSSYWFNDVTASNTGKWSADAIDFLAANSIVEGGSYGTFNPNGNMTRGDFVLMLYRLAGKPSVSGISNPFTDVKATDYYYNAILWAYRNDIVTGIDRKTFAPKKNITREQIAATLYRMAGSPSTSGSISGYYDASKVHSYATNAMRWAVAGGVVTGSTGYLTPTNNATRAQVATMLHRYLTK